MFYKSNVVYFQSRRKKRKAINTVYNEVEKWENGVVNYLIEPSHYLNPDTVRAKVRSSIQPIEDATCIR